MDTIVQITSEAYVKPPPKSKCRFLLPISMVRVAYQQLQRVSTEPCDSRKCSGDYRLSGKNWKQLNRKLGRTALAGDIHTGVHRYTLPLLVKIRSHSGIGRAVSILLNIEHNFVIYL